MNIWTIGQADFMFVSDPTNNRYLFSCQNFLDGIFNYCTFPTTIHHLYPGKLSLIQDKNEKTCKSSLFDKKVSVKIWA